MPYKKVDITGEGTEVVDGGRGTPVDVVQEPTNELEKANTRFIASDKAPKKTVVDSDLQILGKYYDKDGNELTRSELGDAITADEIDSENATSGKVLTANGDGGASWENAASGLTNPVNDDLIISAEDESETFKLIFRVQHTGYTVGVNLFAKYGTFFGNVSADYLESGYPFKTNLLFVDDSINRMQITVATTGTITKAQADDYVKAYKSGWLLYDGDDKFIHSVMYYNNSATNGSKYLILQYITYTTSGNIDHARTIHYTVNADGDLDVQIVYDV